MDKKSIKTAAQIVKRLVNSGLGLESALASVCGAYGLSEGEAAVRDEVVKLGVVKKDLGKKVASHGMARGRAGR